MDPRIVVVLIVMGTLLVMTPPASDYLHGRNIALAADSAATESQGPWRIRLGERMSGEYRFGCWSLGAVMMMTGVVCARSSWRQE